MNGNQMFDYLEKNKEEFYKRMLSEELDAKEKLEQQRKQNVVVIKMNKKVFSNKNYHQP